MSALADDNKNDRLFCWEQVARTNRAFRISQTFAARDDAERLLPLYAFFSIIDQVCSRSSDEGLALSKLNWWRMECSPEKLQVSHHPVLREFRRTGILQRLESGHIKNLLDDAESRLVASAPADISDLKHLCIDSQEPRFNMELAVCEPKGEAVKPNPGALARSGLLQFIRESVERTDQDAYWWIPMNLLARHGISRDALRTSPELEKASRLYSELYAESESWVESTAAGHVGSAGHASLRNYYAITGIYNNKINGLKSISPDRYSAELGRIRMTDLVMAWRCARRLWC